MPNGSPACPAPSGPSAGRTPISAWEPSRALRRRARASPGASSGVARGDDREDGHRRGGTPLAPRGGLQAPQRDALAVPNRMPVILDPEQYEIWLSPATTTDRAKAMLQPYVGGYDGLLGSQGGLQHEEQQPSGARRAYRRGLSGRASAIRVELSYTPSLSSPPPERSEKEKDHASECLLPTP